MASANFAVALHAGTCDTWNSDALHQQKVEKILKDIAETAGAKLLHGAKALDVVQAVVTSLEDCPLFNAGKGAVLNEDGEHELEAAIADGASGAYGAVAATRNVKNPIDATRAVMEQGRHSLLVGPAADEFARKSRVTMVPNDYFTTATKRSRWEARACRPLTHSEDLETVGAVALDIHGNLAAASSTGGLTCKMKGRKAAVICSGGGEGILRHCVAGKVAALKGTESLNESMAQVILNKAEKLPSACAIIAITSAGHIAVESSGRVFPIASCTPSSSTSSVLSSTIHVLSQHVFYRDALVVAGLTRYPMTPSHAVVACHGVDDLMSLAFPTFLNIMYTVRRISATVNSGSSTHRCGLTNDSSGVISLIPLHGLSKDWKAVVHNEEEYNAIFPGYLTSKNGPKMADPFLEKTRSRIVAYTGIAEPFNIHFNGEASNQNIFARIVRGELPHWRIWEDQAYVAFLTPFGNTPGYTVLVPRKHLGSDIFRLYDKDFTGMVEAAHKVAQYLKRAFSAKRCGIFFEGYEVDYAHVKVIELFSSKEM